MPKYVITGGPSSGKTTTVEELERREFEIVHETAAEVIKEMQSEGKDVAEHFEELQTRIFELQLATEAALGDGVHFLDRSIIDGLAYRKARDLDLPKERIEAAKKTKYDKVFLMELLPFVEDGIRFESSIEEVLAIQEQTKQTYEEYGYEVILVPVMSVIDRVKFILQHLKK